MGSDSDWKGVRPALELLRSLGVSCEARVISAHRTPALAAAYAVLGVTAQDEPDTIKKAYRRLMSQHHPDKLVSKGLPEEMMRIAAQKTREIREAYERVREARGF
jgi:DnaJ-domain-containing protein 1